MDPFTKTLRLVRGRLAVQQAIQFVVVGAVASCSGCCMWLVFTRFFPVLPLNGLVCLGVVGAGTLVSVAWAVYRRPTILDAALEADRRLGLQERVTSSLQLADAVGPMVEALHADARNRLARVEVRAAFPFLAPRSIRWLAVPVLLFGIGYLFLPEFDLFGFRARQAQAQMRDEARRIQAERLKAVARPLAEPAAVATPEGIAEAGAALERLAEQLAVGELTEKQALAKLSNVGEELEKRREALQQAAALPKLASALGQLSSAQDMAKNMLNGDFGSAAQKARELQQQLRDGKLSPDERKRLVNDFQKLSDALKSGGENSTLSEALAKAAASLNLSNLSPEALQQAAQGLSAGALSLEDVASILEQLDKLNIAVKDILKCQQKMLGPSPFCRICGVRLKPCTGSGNCGFGCSCCGICSNCGQRAGCFGRGPWRMGFSNKFGNGMGGPGHGRGSSVGPLPDVQEAFEPSMLPGQITKGKFLADIVQRTTPDQTAESTTAFVSGLVAEAQQEAEQALTKEEIPPAAREFVREYFSTFESNEQPQNRQQSATQ